MDDWGVQASGEHLHLPEEHLGPFCSLPKCYGLVLRSRDFAVLGVVLSVEEPKQGLLAGDACPTNQCGFQPYPSTASGLETSGCPTIQRHWMR